MFLDRQIWANSAHPDQTASRGAVWSKVYNVCHTVRIFWIHYSVVKCYCSNFRIITAFFSGAQILKIFTVFTILLHCAVVKPHCSKFRTIRAIFGVSMFTFKVHVYVDIILGPYWLSQRQKKKHFLFWNIVLYCKTCPTYLKILKVSVWSVK